MLLPPPTGTSSTVSHAKQDNQKEREKYENLQGYDAKKAFRLDWAAKKLKQIDESCKATERFRETDETSSFHWSFDRIVEEEGGRHNIANVKATPHSTHLSSDILGTFSSPIHSLSFS